MQKRAKDCAAGVELPFVSRSKAGVVKSWWNVPPAADYDEACCTGARHAAALAVHIKADPDGITKLMWIVEDMDFTRKDKRGYCIGFFTHIGVLIANAMQDSRVAHYTSRTLVARDDDQRLEIVVPSTAHMRGQPCPTT
jgi:hypothetical protein